MLEHRTTTATIVIRQLADHLTYDDITDYELRQIQKLQKAIEQLQDSINDLKEIKRCKDIIENLDS